MSRGRSRIGTGSSTRPGSPLWTPLTPSLGCVSHCMGMEPYLIRVLHDSPSIVLSSGKNLRNLDERWRVGEKCAELS